MLLESLESRILYSAAPVAFADVQAEPAFPDATHEVASTPLAAAEARDAAFADPVSISDALGLVGAQVQPWSNVKAESANTWGVDSQRMGEEPPERRFTYDGAPVAEIYRTSAEFGVETPATGVDEDLVLRSAPDSENFVLNSSPEAESEVTAAGNAHDFRLASAMAPERVLMAVA